MLRKGCFFNFSILLLFFAFSATAGNFKVILPADTHLCYGAEYKIVANFFENQGSYRFKWSTGDSASVFIKTGKLVKDTLFIITATDSAGNSSIDSIRIFVKQFPQIIISPIPSACSNDTSLIILNNYVIPKTGNWFMDTAFLVGNNKFDPKLSGEGYFWVRYDYKDIATGCSDTDFIQIVVNPVPKPRYTFYPSTGSAPLQVLFTNKTIQVPGHNSAYLWNFGDGGTSNLNSPNHIFLTQGSFVIQLTATDTTTGCKAAYDDSLVVGPQVSFLDLGGYVYADAASATKSKAYLINFSSTISKYVIIDTTDVIDSNGFYLFKGLKPDNYMVKIIPDSISPVYRTFFPTYYGDVLFWNRATIIQLNANGYHYDVYLVKGNNPTGTGSISGTVVRNMTSAGNIQVMLLSATLNPVIYSYSGNKGYFEFSKLPFNVYHLFTELVGEITYPATITLTPTNASIKGIYLEIVSQNGITEDFQSQSFAFGRLFPNPVVDYTNLRIAVPKDIKVEINIYNTRGRLTEKKNITLVSGENLISIDLKNLPRGIFLMNFELSGNILASYKIVKE